MLVYSMYYASPGPVVFSGHISGRACGYLAVLLPGISGYSLVGWRLPLPDRPVQSSMSAMPELETPPLWHTTVYTSD